MTREEAIAHGKEQLEVFGGEHREFIEKAIKALEKEPVIDKIRAEIDSLHNGCGLFNDGIDKALDIIDKYKVESEEIMSKETTCENCIYANACIMYEPKMRRCKDYREVIESCAEIKVIPIPPRATNGDMIKAMFPNAQIDYHEKSDLVDDYVTVFIKDCDTCQDYSYAWWNEPYEGDEDKE